jgi:hypothetical protein
MSEIMHSVEGRLTPADAAALERVVDTLRRAAEKKVLRHVHESLVSARERQANRPNVRSRCRR